MTTGNVFGPLLFTQGILASSKMFQALVGVQTAADAAAYIHLFEADDTIDARPRAILNWSDWTSEKVDVAHFNSQGTILISFEFPPQGVDYWPPGYWGINYWGVEYWPDVDAPTTTQGVLTQFGKWLDAIVAELQANASQQNPDDASHTFINVQTLRLQAGPRRSNAVEENGDDFCWAKFHLEHQG